MFTISTLDDIETLRESCDLECKLAAGADGRCKLPDDFWATYSAFANTQGVVVVLGIREKNAQFTVQGIPQPQKVITELFNNANNPQKVSHNLLHDQDVQTLDLNGKTVVLVNIPKASRKQRPIFLNGNPFGNTYRRLQEGDRRCDDETIKRMLAEQVDDSRDARILKNYGPDDIDWESFRIYRLAFRDNKPDHAWLDLPDWELLKRLGGWRKDRETGEEGLTVAGLLMFGRWESIQEALPNYFVDYQEQTLPNTLERWSDRLVPDGSWSGNLYDFFRRVYRKLIVDLKVPFKLEDGVRRDDTPIHKALREALVNTLVHADYTGRSSVQVIKQPDMFSFRNPGNMRVPVEQALQGGESDCRNRTLHQLFLMIGIGERAGSGIPTILKGWEQGNWRPPVLFEKTEPEQTILELRMLDLVPGPILVFLHRWFGQEFISLTDLQKLIMATAFIERVVSHSRIKDITSVHPYDLSKALQELVRKGFMESVGRGRSTQYHLLGYDLPSPEDVFAAPSRSSSDSSSEHLATSSEHLANSSEHLATSSEHLANSSEHLANNEESAISTQRDEKGRWVSKHLSYPAIDDLTLLDRSFYEQLTALAREPRNSKRLAQETMQQVILSLCREQYITLQALAQLVARSPDALRQQYLSQMVKEGLLKLAFPQTPTHERQAYRTAKS